MTQRPFDHVTAFNAVQQAEPVVVSGSVAAPHGIPANHFRMDGVHQSRVKLLDPGNVVVWIRAARLRHPDAPARQSRRIFVDDRRIPAESRIAVHVDGNDRVHVEQPELEELIEFRRPGIAAANRRGAGQHHARVSAPDIVVEILEFRHVVFRRDRDRIDIRIRIADLSRNFPHVSGIHGMQSVECRLPSGTLEIRQVNDREDHQPHPPGLNVIRETSAVEMSIEADPRHLSGSLKRSCRIHLDVERWAARTLDYDARRPGIGVCADHGGVDGRRRDG